MGNPRHPGDNSETDDDADLLEGDEDLGDREDEEYGGEFEDDDPEQWEGADSDEMMFADPSGRSALRAASPTNPRDRECPNCGRPNVLTPADVALGYQCDACADQTERGGP